MKKVIFICSFLLIGLYLSAQVNPWEGFFKPVNTRVEKVFFVSHLKSTFKGTVVTIDSTSFLWSPDVTLTASFYPLGAGAGTVQALNSAGIGLSYGNYSLINGSAYCNYSINVDFMSQVNLNGASTAGFGGAVSVAVLNKFLRLGVAVIGTNGFSNAHVGPIFGISTSF